MSLFKGRTTVTRANKISDFTIATAEYGSAVPEILGTTRIGGNVLYYDDFTAHEHKETHRAGKGGRSKQVNITYTYTVASIIGLCEGEISGIGRIWKDKDVYKYPSDDVELTLYKGTQDQLPWAYVSGKHPDKALSYSGLAYMAGVLDLGDSASFPNFNFEVKGKLLNTGDGVDVNPADYIRYVLDKVGLTNVEIDGINDYRKYCANADMLISTPMDDTSAQSAQSIINDIMTCTNSYMFWSNDRFKIVPLEDRPCGNWKPNTTIMYDLTPDNFIPLNSDGALITFERKDSSEVYNQFPVEFINRENSYEKETVSYAVNSDIQTYGVRQASTLKAHYLYKTSRAVRLAEMWARRVLYGRNLYTFKLDWAFCRLEVGDLVTLTDPTCGLEKQLVMINSVTEDANGVPTFTAVSRPPMTVTPAKYTVNEVDRPFVDYNVTPPDTDTPLIIQPPADLTQTGYELWIGAKGKGDGWGGCSVYISDDNTNYRFLGRVSNTARLGTLAHDVTKEATTIVVKSNGSYLSGTKQDAERGNTLCWLDGECFSYETATLLDDGSYQFTNCIRGQYNTTASAHNAGAQFARLDQTLLKQVYLKEDIGKTLYLKFCSYNIFGANEQDISSVEPVTYTIAKYYVPSVTNITMYNRYRRLSDGVTRYDIVVKWTPPNITSYAYGQVWYKTNHSQVANVVNSSLSAKDAGFAGEWIFAGNGKDEVVIPQAIVGDTYRVCVTTVDQFGASTTPDTAPYKDILVAMKSYIPNVPDNFRITFGSSATVFWDEVTNTDIAYYEVRTDEEAGVEGDGLLARTTGVKADIPLTTRSGTLYLFARNALGKYSQAAILKYNKPLPPTPNAPTLTPTLGGFGVTASSIPSGCTGMTVYVNDKDAVRTVNNVLSYTCKAGIYNVKIAYYDMFGEGDTSQESTVTVKIEIDKDMIKDEAISLEKVDKAVQAKIEAGETAEASVNVVIDNLNSADGIKNYSALTQMSDDINLRVKKGDVINQINVSTESILIDGKKIHITGDTVFDNGVIVQGMLAAKAVTADNLMIGSEAGARLAIKKDLIEVYDSNGTLRVKLGVWNE